MFNILETSRFSRDHYKETVIIKSVAFTTVHTDIFIKPQERWWLPLVVASTFFGKIQTWS